MDTKLVFLHIPKTAGQSLHASLEAGFGQGAVCPARINEQLGCLSIEQLNSYRVVSGHFDWSLLDCISGPKYVFTVLRDPLERLLSFYFFLRNEALKLTVTELNKASNVGKKAILTLRPDEYFTAGPAPIRTMLDNLYDNFYTYYFAGRVYRSRQMLNARVDAGLITPEKIFEMALSNVERLDSVFFFDDIEPAFEMIRKFSPNDIGESAAYTMNVNDQVSQAERLFELEKLGATRITFDKLKSLCMVDNRLIEVLNKKSGAETPLFY